MDFQNWFMACEMSEIRQGNVIVISGNPVMPWGGVGWALLELTDALDP